MFIFIPDCANFFFFLIIIFPNNLYAFIKALYYSSTFLGIWCPLFIFFFLKKIMISLKFRLRSYNTLSLTLIWDLKSFLFIWSILLIAFSVFFFSANYIKIEIRNKQFHFLVSLFIFSILILISRKRLEALILGWDGLGITSFFLVLYYNNSVRLRARYLTLIVNRLGDGFFLILFAICFSRGINWFQEFTIKTFALSLLILGAFTKRAQIPFSAWLPAAIAAPTPVSALVHSSTLVTAGIYVIIQLETTWIFNKIFIRETLFFFGCATIIIARLSGLFEKDIKKIVALSTLSQLGLIVTSLATGIKLFVIFHLFNHAYFKALLFIASGRIIHSIKGYQDIRKHGIWFLNMPITSIIISLSRFSLIGFPFISGFFSKDLVIERFWEAQRSVFKFFLLYLSIYLTIAYTFRFIYHVFATNFAPSFSLRGEKCLFLNLRVLFLFIIRVISGLVFRFFLINNNEIFRIFPEIKFLIISVLSWSFISQKKYNLKLPIFFNWRMGCLFRLYEIKKQILKKSLFKFSNVFNFYSENSFWFFIWRNNFIKTPHQNTFFFSFFSQSSSFVLIIFFINFLWVI